MLSYEYEIKKVSWWKMLTYEYEIKKSELGKNADLWIWNKKVSWWKVLTCEYEIKKKWADEKCWPMSMKLRKVSWRKMLNYEYEIKKSELMKNADLWIWN